MSNYIKEISIKQIEDVFIGHAQNDEAKTGVSVIYFKNGAQVGCDISGGGPASRETPLTSPFTADNPINAVVLSGGSAFGLAAGDGVMKCLEDNKIGLDTGDTIIPLVVQSCIYDLEYGSSDIRPDAAMGYEACRNALDAADIETIQRGGAYRTAAGASVDAVMGNVGAGTGATVGKLLELPQAQKAGLGIHAIQAGDLKIAAVVVLNACGDIFDPENGQKIAGLMDKERKEFVDYEDTMIKMVETAKDCKEAALEKTSPVTNTTIGCIITNAKFNKAKMNKVASMTRSAYSRCIDPVGMMWDGDTIYAASIGSIECDISLAGALAAKAMQKAIVKAVETAKIEEQEYRKYAHI